jgi:hypothetical protein
MGLDEATCMLLLGITLLSPDRPGLTEKSKISEIQEKFVDHLEKYVKWRFGPSRGQVNYLFIHTPLNFVEIQFTLSACIVLRF